MVHGSASIPLISVHFEASTCLQDFLGEVHDLFSILFELSHVSDICNWMRMIITLFYLSLFRQQQLDRGESHPQLSLPRAGQSITTMDTARHHSPCRYEEELVGEEGKGCATRTLIMFGGGDNEGNFYSDLTTIAVEELLDGI